MKKTIEKYLKKLEKSFNHDWIFNFHSLIDIFYKQPLLLKLIKGFQKLYELLPDEWALSFNK